MEPAGVQGEPSRTFVIGVGNDDRGDDGVGLHVARAVKRMCIPGVTVLESGDGAGALEACAAADTVVLVDAARGGGRPGTVYRFDVRAQPLPAVFGRPFSTHGLGVVEAIELSRALHRLPRRLIVYGVEVSSFAPGDDLSPEAEHAAAEVVAGVLAELR
jgi:hydrogenase maturation protease